jgi:hypothetical protein
LKPPERQCEKCEEHGWHFREGENWEAYYPHDAVVTVEVDEATD